MEKGKDAKSSTLSYSKLQAKRRDEALSRQKHARTQQFNMARIVHGQADKGDQEECADTTELQPEAAMAVDSCAADGSQHTSQQPSSSISQQNGWQGRTHQQGRGRGRRGANGTRAQRVGGGSDGFGVGGVQGGDVNGSVSGSVQGEGEGGEHPRAMFARQLQHPEWLTDVPQDLAQNWLVLPRPEGQRCLVVTSKGKTIVRGRTGAVLCMSTSGLPEGSHATQGARSDFCVLDAVLHEASSTLFICDVLVWRGYSLVECAAEFRSFWLSTKMAEDPEATQAMLLLTLPQQHTHQLSTQGMGEEASMDQDQQDHEDMELQPGMQQHTHEGTPKRRGGYASVPRLRVSRLPIYPADAAGIQAAYGGHSNSNGCASASCEGTQGGAEQDFERDGLLFMHREGRYESGSVGTPLVLQWKDAGCSRYPIDTAADGSPLQYQVVTLEYRMDCTVSTSDAPPVVLGVMPQQWVQAMGPKLLRPGRLLKFSVREGGIIFAPDGRPAGAALAYEGCGNQRRGRADAFNKILFQQLARTTPITLDHLLSCAGNTVMQAENGGVMEDG